jgi:AcrR family transcriptional regulator
MGIKERKQRNRLNMRQEILQAALNIVREEGYRSLSLRRLANNIEYSATMVYLYFKNKDALLIDLSKLGYQQLNATMDRNCKNISDPRTKLKAMLATYWHFATHEKELYLLMQETEMRLRESEPQFPELLAFFNSIILVTRKACENKSYTETFLKRKCLTSIALVQGFASLNLKRKDIDVRSGSQMLDEAIDCIIDSLN